MNNINAVETIRSILNRKGLFYQENIAFFVNPMFEEAIVGQTVEGNLIYDFSIMIKTLQQNILDENIVEKIIRYNLIEQYFPKDSLQPIIMHPAYTKEWENDFKLKRR